MSRTTPPYNQNVPEDFPFPTEMCLDAYFEPRDKAIGELTHKQLQIVDDSCPRNFGNEPGVINLAFKISAKRREAIIEEYRKQQERNKKEQELQQKYAEIQETISKTFRKYEHKWNRQTSDTLNKNQEYFTNIQKSIHLLSTRSIETHRTINQIRENTDEGFEALKNAIKDCSFKLERKTDEIAPCIAEMLLNLQTVSLQRNDAAYTLLLKNIQNALNTTENKLEERLQDAVLASADNTHETVKLNVDKLEERIERLESSMDALKLQIDQAIHLLQQPKEPAKSLGLPVWMWIAILTVIDIITALAIPA